MTTSAPISDDVSRRVEHASVDGDVRADSLRREDAGDGNARQDRLPGEPAAQDQFLLGADVRGDEGERNGESSILVSPANS